MHIPVSLHNIQYKIDDRLTFALLVVGLSGWASRHTTPLGIRRQSRFQGNFECAFGAAVFGLRPFDAIYQILQLTNPLRIAQWGSV